MKTKITKVSARRAFISTETIGLISSLRKTIDGDGYLNMLKQAFIHLEGRGNVIFRQNSTFQFSVTCGND
jgi:hypothetical protein